MNKGDSVSSAGTARGKSRGVEQTQSEHDSPTNKRAMHSDSVQQRWKRLMDIIDR